MPILNNVPELTLSKFHSLLNPHGSLPSPGLHCGRIVHFNGVEQGSATFARRVHFGPISHQLLDHGDIAIVGSLNQWKAATWHGTAGIASLWHMEGKHILKRNLRTNFRVDNIQSTSTMHYPTTIHYLNITFPQHHITSTIHYPEHHHNTFSFTTNT